MRLALILLLGMLLARAAQAGEDPGEQASGEYLARAGDCVACHSVPGGKAFAGGLKMATPAGIITATNITPDPETGIGRYTLQDFDRALRRGIAADGHHLYPAMPYPSYAKLTDADVAALYDFFMHGVAPVHQTNAPNSLSGLASRRWTLGFWNALWAPSPGFKPDPRQDAAWNRGAYLVEGLGHCGACHTPRGMAMHEAALDSRDKDFLAGARLDDWYAPSLRRNLATGLGGWTAADIVAFLKTGRNAHGSAYGSMRDVIDNSTPWLSDADLAAIATYLGALPATRQESAPAYEKETATALLEGSTRDPGARVYAARCQACHRETGNAAPPFVPPLAGNPTVLDSDPISLINIVLNGSTQLAPRGRPEAYRMPQFRAQLNDQDVADVVSFIRAAWGNRAAPVQASAVAALRGHTSGASDAPVLLHMR